MKINKVTLKNFKSYYGEWTFDLSVTDSKNVVVIFADGGYGKTTLMQAINWVLYDEAFIDEFNIGKKPKERISIKNWINESYLNEVIESKCVGEVTVEMQYVHDSETHSLAETHNIINKITFNAESHSDIRILSSNQMLKKLPSGGSWTTSSNVKVDINRILPVSIKNYFIFDAEKQSNLIMPTNQDKVQEAIFKVVGLQAVQNSIDHLKEVAKEYSRELSKLDLGDINAFQRKKTELEDQIDEEEKSIKLEKIEINNLAGFIDEIESKLRGMPDSSATQLEIDRLKGQKNELLKAKLKDESELSKLCYKSIPFLIFGNLNDFHNKLLNLKNEGKIPGSISMNLLNEIWSTNKCICGISLLEETNVSKECKQRLELLSREIQNQSDDKQKILDIFNSTSYYLSSLAEQNKNGIKDTISILDNMNEAISNIESEIQELEAQLAGIDDQNIKELADNKEKLVEDQARLNQNVGRLSTQLELHRKELEEVRILLSTLVSKNALAMELTAYERKAREAISTLEEIFTNFSEQARKEISIQTQIHWHNLINSTKKLNVEVDISYSLKVSNMLGQSAIYDLSEGQKQSLVLAFVAAISDASQKFPPYIIDMPFGRLGERVQIETSQFLPKASHQVILLLNKTSEWNDTTKQYLNPSINKLIELEFDPEQRKTSIINHKN